MRTIAQDALAQHVDFDEVEDASSHDRLVQQTSKKLDRARDYIRGQLSAEMRAAHPNLTEERISKRVQRHPKLRRLSRYSSAINRAKKREGGDEHLQTIIQRLDDLMKKETEG
jgi:hypothetical protein